MPLTGMALSMIPVISACTPPALGLFLHKGWQAEQGEQTLVCHSSGQSQSSLAQTPHSLAFDSSPKVSGKDRQRSLRFSRAHVARFCKFPSLGLIHHHQPQEPLQGTDCKGTQKSVSSPDFFTQGKGLAPKRSSHATPPHAFWGQPPSRPLHRTQGSDRQ